MRGVEVGIRDSLSWGDMGDMGSCPDVREFRAPVMFGIPRSRDRFCARDVVEWLTLPAYGEPVPLI